MKLLQIFTFFALIFYGIVKILYKFLDFYALSSNRFRDTPLAKKYIIPQIDKQINNLFVKATTLKDIDVKRIQEKLAYLLFFCGISILILLTLLKILISRLGFSLSYAVESGTSSLGLFIFSLGIIFILSLRWVFEHKKAFYVLLSIFSIVSLLMIIVIAVLVITTGQNVPLSEKLFVFGYFVIGIILAFILIYIPSWIILGSPTALIKFFQWSISKTSVILKDNYSDHNLTYVMMIAKIFVWASEFILFVFAGLTLYYDAFKK